MVMGSGEIVLLDCGIAASFRAVTDQPPERWAFVAPELQGVDVAAAGLNGRQSVAADLYSLGALVYFLVTGQPPALPPSRTRQTRRAPAIVPDIPGVSGNLGAALRTLLSPEPDDRPESAAVLVDWLAGGVGAARDRRQLIADGLRAMEGGAQRASQVRPAGDTQAKREPPVKVPGPTSGQSESVRTGMVPMKAAMKAAVPRRRRVFFAVVLSALAAVAMLLVFGPWPGRRETLPGRDRSQGSRSVGKTPPEARNPRGELGPAKGGEEPPAEETTLGESVLARVAGHLIVETVPPGATVWVDGAIKGKTFADIVVGQGGHRIVLIAPGHRMFRDVVDTSRGAIVRRTLVPIEPPTRGNGFIDVECLTSGEFPVSIDEEETGLLCPAKMPISPGKHLVGIFVPAERRTVLVETTVASGPKPAVVKFSE